MLATLGIRYLRLDQVDLSMATIVCALPLVLPLVYFMMKRLSQMKLRDVTREAKLLLVGIPVALWTLIPIYHMLLFALSTKDEAFSGRLWPAHPTLSNFALVFEQKNYWLNHFWLQLWNSLLIAVAVGRDHAVRRDGRGVRDQPAEGEGRTAGDEPARCSPTSSRRRSWPCRCTRRWAPTGC